MSSSSDVKWVLIGLSTYGGQVLELRLESSIGNCDGGTVLIGLFIYGGVKDGRIVAHPVVLEQCAIPIRARFSTCIGKTG